MLNVDQMGFATVIHTQFENREPFGTPAVVALVEIDKHTYTVDKLLAQVFKLTNNIDKSWCKNEQVITISTKAGCRSTSAGDIIKIDDDFWRVAPVGFDKLNGAPEEWHTARAKLYVDNQGSAEARMATWV
tara:strand:- start:288 stop:680 length:393 start_codon:yes stop_codon:yes gene_type:complete